MELPLQVFIIGLLTVFLVLLVVVLTGKVIIWFVNSFFEPARAGSSATVAGNRSRVNPRVVAAITAAVNSASGGKGRITNIEKL